MEPTIYKPSIYKGAGIYKTGAEGGGGGGYLPEGYKKITYLETDGTSFCQYNLDEVIRCDNIQMNVNFEIHKNIFAPGYKDTEFFMVYNEQGRKNGFGFRLGASEYIPYFYTTNITYGLSNHINSERCVIEFKNTSSQLITNYGSRGIGDVQNNIKSFRLFTDNRPKELRVLDSFILDGDTNKVIFTILPCIEIETGIYGFFDIIGNKFYSATTGTFTGGL